MNRGRGRQTIFHDENYFQAFLQTLGEANGRFDAIVHAYCLMDNHYHLLIETPRANFDTQPFERTFQYESRLAGTGGREFFVLKTFGVLNWSFNQGIFLEKKLKTSTFSV